MRATQGDIKLYKGIWKVFTNRPLSFVSSIYGEHVALTPPSLPIIRDIRSSPTFHYTITVECMALFAFLLCLFFNFSNQKRASIYYLWVSAKKGSCHLAFIIFLDLSKAILILKFLTKALIAEFIQ